MALALSRRTTGFLPRGVTPSHLSFSPLSVAMPSLAADAVVVGRRFASSKAKEAREPLVLSETVNSVRRLTLNNPKRLNAWTHPMLLDLFAKFEDAATDSDVEAVIVTGSDPYYCAGADLSSLITPSHPKVLHELIREKNQLLFDTFIKFPKPLFVAVNGPAIGASVTSATLCDGIIASDRATFHTPFHSLGIVPEGCSSVHFEYLMGKDNAERMLGAEGWKPTAQEALDAKLITSVVPHEELIDSAQKVAEEWVAAKKPRAAVEAGRVDLLLETNAKESVDLATAFFSEGFLSAQYNFLSSKGKMQPAMLFAFLKATRPLWKVLLP